MSPASSPLSDDLKRDLIVLLLTFATVTLVDLVAISLLTGQLRVWFPVWLDPAWATRADPWVVYSQSYIAGIALIPLLLALLDKACTRGRTGARLALWAIGLAIFAFIAWWKGGLMIEHDKEREALGWLALTGLSWLLIRATWSLPERLQTLTGRDLLRALVTILAGFFLVLAVVDPLLQLVVQGLDWSTGLAIEVGFSLPAGLLLLLARRRLAR